MIQAMSSKGGTSSVWDKYNQEKSFLMKPKIVKCLWIMPIIPLKLLFLEPATGAPQNPSTDGENLRKIEFLLTTVERNKGCANASELVTFGLEMLETPVPIRTDIGPG